MADSKCSISAIQTKRALLPFFQNMVAETKENMKKVAKFPLCGNWAQPQSGTEFLSLPWEEWPVSRESASELPSDELIVGDKPVFPAALRAHFCLKKGHTKNPCTAIEELLFYSDDIRKVLRILARYLRGLEAGFRKSYSP